MKNKLIYLSVILLVVSLMVGCGTTKVKIYNTSTTNQLKNVKFGEKLTIEETLQAGEYSQEYEISTGLYTLTYETALTGSDTWATVPAAKVVKITPKLLTESVETVELAPFGVSF